MDLQPSLVSIMRFKCATDWDTQAKVRRLRALRPEDVPVTHERERVAEREPAPYPLENVLEEVLNLLDRERDGGIHSLCHETVSL